MCGWHDHMVFWPCKQGNQRSLVQCLDVCIHLQLCCVEGHILAVSTGTPCTYARVRCRPPQVLDLPGLRHRRPQPLTALLALGALLCLRLVAECRRLFCRTCRDSTSAPCLLDHRSALHAGDHQYRLGPQKVPEGFVYWPPTRWLSCTTGH